MKFTKRAISSGSGVGSNVFLRLKDGENKTGIPRGEIYEFRTKWANGKSSVVPESDPAGRPRFRMNFVVYDDGFKPLIWEFGVQIYNQLADIADVYDLTKTKIRVSRTGSTKDNTSYNILPILKEPVSANAMNAIEAVKLNVLNADKQESSVPDFGPPPDEPPPFPDFAEDELPF